MLFIIESCNGEVLIHGRIHMCHLDKIQFEIVSGQYQTADLEEKQMIRELMGDNEVRHSL